MGCACSHCGCDCSGSWDCYDSHSLAKWLCMLHLKHALGGPVLGACGICCQAGKLPAFRSRVSYKAAQKPPDSAVGAAAYA